MSIESYLILIFLIVIPILLWVFKAIKIPKTIVYIEALCEVAIAPLIMVGLVIYLIYSMGNSNFIYLFGMSSFIILLLFLDFIWAIGRINRYKNKELYDEIENRAENSKGLRFIKILIVFLLLGISTVSLVYLL